MKKMKLNVKPAKKIEKTHATEEPKKEKEAPKEAPKEAKKKEKRIYNPNASGSPKSKTLSFRVSEEELEKINAELQKRGTSFSALVRELLKKEGVI